MKQLALQEYEDLQKYKETPHFNSLSKLNEKNFESRLTMIKYFRAFYDVCQEAYDQEKIALKQLERDGAFKTGELEFERYADGYNQKI